MKIYSRWYWFKWRIASRYFPVPEPVTVAWYVQECPLDDSFVCPRLSIRERVNWALSQWLREC